ncbi:MAG: 4-hydroxy-tetrahydrodipicolinate synthase [Chlamydiales bacterium]|jgi:4-hydroxy-tetrahydrodipicolinate synthase
MHIDGVYTALVTPFTEGELNPEGLRQNIRHQLDNHVTGILALGTTGEAPTLSLMEKESIIKISVEEAQGKVPVMVGTGSYCTSSTIDSTYHAKELGADIALVIAPYYNKPSQRGIFHHFEEVCKNVDIPVLVYNIPGRTGVNIDTDTMKDISRLPNIIGVKEASGNLEQITNVIHTIANDHDNFSVLSGDDLLTLAILALGGKGVVSVISNLVPDSVVALTKAGINGDFSKCRELHYELLPLIKAAFLESNPVPIKEAMDLCGLSGGRTRLPLCEVSEKTKTHLEKVLRDMNLLTSDQKVAKHAKV